MLDCSRGLVGRLLPCRDRGLSARLAACRRDQYFAQRAALPAAALAGLPSAVLQKHAEVMMGGLAKCPAAKPLYRYGLYIWT
jgi:hypothetical protein